MKIIVSPTKSLDFESKVPTKLYSQPRFLDQSKKLNTILKTLSKSDIGNLMSVSEALSQLNYERNQNWETPFTKENAKQAVYSFTGAVFKGIDVNSLPEEKIPVLQDRLRILSGLYGVLKPLDLIQPYRLEMGTKLKVDNTENLYKFWNNELANSLNEELKDDELLINLASAEYFKALPAKALKVPMITPVFKDLKNGQYKIVMTYAKKARGLMVRFIIENDINTVEQLKGFNVDNYRFSDEMSTETELLFTR
ncbi:peroxide stress protein YaaA [uncultured Polaribacter sp.]|jgi:hypothetical protein|uniref:peroxide stress protein YaaA n=1 Tax=uncultured Polaribacter sp. TaxID=174711 RepID=UPI003704D306